MSQHKATYVMIILWNYFYIMIITLQLYADYHSIFSMEKLLSTNSLPEHLNIINFNCACVADVIAK